MIVASSIILQNILYLAGAVALIIILSVAVTLRHRRPVSVESHMESFNKGLKALAPDAPQSKRKSRSEKTATLPPPAASHRPRSVQPIVARPKSEPVAQALESSTPTSLEAETG